MAGYTNVTAVNITLMRALLPNGGSQYSDGVLTFYLESAEAAVLKKAFPVGSYTEAQKQDVLTEYENVEMRIALALVAKDAVWGETAHSENGISRSYDSSDVPKSLLDQIVPHCKMYFRS